MLVMGAITAYTNMIITKNTTVDSTDAWLKMGGTARGVKNNHGVFRSFSVRFGPKQALKPAMITGTILSSSIPKPNTVLTSTS